MRVDYHVHTCYSFDCSTTLEDVASSAVRAGLDRIHITDHDTLEGAQRLIDMRPAGLDVVAGCELSATDGSQVIGLGLRTVVPSTTVIELMEGIKSQGGQVLIPHPFRQRSGVFRAGVKRSPGFLDAVLELTDLIECFNGSDIYQANQASYRFAMEHGIAVVAGSDAHTPEAIGSAHVDYVDETAADEAARGSTPRSIWFPDQRHTPDVTRIKRIFHRLPTRIQDAARSSRRSVGLEPARATAADARRQYEFPVRADGGGP
jgi:predicted metal-dependent phosphoesterase TrpH